MFIDARRRSRSDCMPPTIARCRHRESDAEHTPKSDTPLRKRIPPRGQASGPPFRNRQAKQQRHHGPSPASLGGYMRVPRGERAARRMSSGRVESSTKRSHRSGRHGPSSEGTTESQRLLPEASAERPERRLNSASAPHAPMRRHKTSCGVSSGGEPTRPPAFRLGPELVLQVPHGLEDHED